MTTNDTIGEQNANMRAFITTQVETIDRLEAILREVAFRTNAPEAPSRYLSNLALSGLGLRERPDPHEYGLRRCRLSRKEIRELAERWKE